MRLYSLGMKWSLRKLRRLPHSPVNTWRKPPNPKNQLSSLILHTHLPLSCTSGFSVNQSGDTRRAQHRARPRYPANPDPLNNPNDWVLTYLAKRDKLPNWWPEFQSPHHRDGRPLSEVQVQELAQKHAAAFRLSTAQREKSAWWNSLSSLASLGHQDFLPSSPSRPKDPRGICMVRRDQMVGLVRALQ